MEFSRHFEVHFSVDYGYPAVFDLSGDINLLILILFFKIIEKNSVIFFIVYYFSAEGSDAIVSNNFIHLT